MNQNNRVVISLPSEREILITRAFNAPRELVFRTITDPALIPLWWGPRNVTTIVGKMDVRVGGEFRFILRSPDGSEIVFYGEYREIEPPERVVQTFAYEGAPGTVLETMTLEEHGGKTTLTVLSLCPTQEIRDGLLASGMEEGVIETYERLEALLAEQIAAAR